MRLSAFLLLIAVAFGPSAAAEPEPSPAATSETNVSVEEQRQQQLLRYEKNLAEVKEGLSRESVWLKSYSSYTTYLEVQKNLAELKQRIAQLSREGKKDEIPGLMAKQKILTEQIGLLEGHGESPFSALMKPEEISDIPTIANPFEIFTGISFIKRLNEQYDSYLRRLDELEQIVKLLRKKVQLYDEIIRIEGPQKYREEYPEILQELEKFETALSTVQATSEVYKKRIEEINLGLNKEIKEQSL